MKPYALATLLFTGLSLSACGSGEDKAADPAPPQGRTETQSIRNTEAIGYSGNEIADKVDGALDASEKRKEENDRQMEEQTQ